MLLVDSPDREDPQIEVSPRATADTGVEALLELARAADPRTGALLFDLCEQQVNRIVWRVLGADDAHDDLVHEVFAALLMSLARLRDAATFEGWVAVVTVNKVRSELRRRRFRRLWQRDEPPDLEQIVAPPPAYEARALLQRTYEVLAKLPTDERIAFTLRFIDEQPLGAVAAACECSLATVKRRIQAARDRFRRLAGRDPMLAERLRSGGEGTNDGTT